MYISCFHENRSKRTACFLLVARSPIQDNGATDVLSEVPLVELIMYLLSLYPHAR